ncbi:MAG: hypothetical protein Q9186_001850 [Xanthomendoza sp. 1 TL-2023]
MAAEPITLDELFLLSATEMTKRDDNNANKIVMFSIPNAKSAFKEDTCNICLQAFSDSKEDAIQLPCRHIFGKACIYEWRTGKLKPGCPLCKRRYTTTLKEMRKDTDEQLRDIKESETLARHDWAVRRYFTTVNKHESWVRPMLASRKLALARGEQSLPSSVASLYKQVEDLERLLETEWGNVKELGERLRRAMSILKSG